METEESTGQRYSAERTNPRPLPESAAGLRVSRAEQDHDVLLPHSCFLRPSRTVGDGIPMSSPSNSGKNALLISC